MQRRDFVRRLPVVTAGLAAAGSTVALGACGGAPFLMPVPAPGGLAVPLSALGIDGDAFLQTADMQRPIYVRRLSDGGYVAVLASCTHRGCQPEPVGDRLECPCHGSEFSFDGAVLSGPAERPLTRYDVSEEDGRIVVSLSEGAR